MLFYEEESTAVYFTTDITSRVEKNFEQENSSSKLDAEINPERKITIIKDANNKKIVHYDSKEDNHQDLNKIYKWKDSNNILIISSDPPPSKVNYEVYYYREDESISLDSSNIKFNSINNNDLSKSISNSPIRVYTPNGLRELINQSKEIGEKLELRGELLDELFELL